MTDRINGFWVVLKEDTRVDDAEVTIAAVRQIKGVLGVSPHVVNVNDWVARQRIRSELERKLFDVLKED